MNVKSYRGKTADECLKKLKMDIGGDAVILQSRTIRPILGRFGKAVHEIVAAGDASAVLDKFAERAEERRAEEQTEISNVGAKTLPRLTLSNGVAGNNAIANQTHTSSRRERLTLAEAAELHEQGAYDRLVAAGVLQTKGAQPAALSAQSFVADDETPPGGDLKIVYSGASARLDSSSDDDRIARLEKQIALLAGSLQKQVEPEARPSSISAPDVFSAVPKATMSQSVVVALDSSKHTTDLQSSSGEDSATPPQPVATGLGGFLRYRLPAVNAEKQADAQSQPRLSESNRANTVKRGLVPGSVPVSKPAAAAQDVDHASEALPVNGALPYLKALRASQVAEPLLRRISAEVPDDVAAGDAREIIHDLLTQRMLIGGGIDGPTSGKMTLAALLGPTGVGKTTTIAKLAANLTLTGGCRVAMVTLDTSRVAAADQLKGYGEAMNIPVRVAYDRGEMEAALLEFARDKVQVVLIDTPGRGPLETLPLAEMSQSLRSVVDLRSYVVIPAPLSASNFENTIQRFIKIAKPNALILTKMDETADNHCLGFLLNAQAKYHLPLAYVTMGARVPDDLLVADAHLLVNKLMSQGL